MKAVFLDYASLDQNDLDFSQLHAIYDELILYPTTLPSELIERIQDVDVIISNKVVVNSLALQQCVNLKLILISATGTNNIDLVQAKAQGVVVCNCQAYGTSAVAQHTLMLMLNLATSFREYDCAVQKGDWSKTSQFCLLDYPIIELAGKTLGIIGFGELGQAVAKLAEAFGMKILVAQLPNRPIHASRTILNELFAQVDFLTLHCPLTEETKNLIDHHEFSLMKKSAFLINCARGGVVNEHALAQALLQHEIAGAATDVLTIEPPQNGNVLLNSNISNLIITPHSAWGSIDARQRIVSQMVENVKAFIDGKPIRQVN